MASITTWVVVADGARARLFRNTGVGKGLEPALDEEFIGPNRRSREIDTDRPGTTFDRGGPGRHGKEPGTDPHRHDQQMFAKEVGKILGKHASRNAYDRLVLVAPPRALGDLRDALPGPVLDKVYGELAKDLTKLSIHDLPEHLKDVMAV